MKTEEEFILDALQDDPPYLTYAQHARNLGKTVAELNTAERTQCDEFWDR
jgi:hypothetical protein